MKKIYTSEGKIFVGKPEEPGLCEKGMGWVAEDGSVTYGKGPHTTISIGVYGDVGGYQAVLTIPYEVLKCTKCGKYIRKKITFEPAGAPWAEFNPTKLGVSVEPNS